MIPLYLLDATYREGATGEREGGRLFHDCWSLAMAVRRHHGLPDLPVMPGHPVVRRTSRTYAVYAQVLDIGPPTEGAIAAVMRGKSCEHVGVVTRLEGRLVVLEINPKTGVRWMSPADFERHYLKVVYHRDRDISQQAAS